MSFCLKNAANFLTILDAAAGGAEMLSVVFVAVQLAILADNDALDKVVQSCTVVMQIMYFGRGFGRICIV